jgi:hypothetical protein
MSLSVAERVLPSMGFPAYAVQTESGSVRRSISK